MKRRSSRVLCQQKRIVDADGHCWPSIMYGHSMNFAASHLTAERTDAGFAEIYFAIDFCFPQSFGVTMS